MRRINSRNKSVLKNMERPLTLKPLSIQDENSAIHRKKATVDGKSRTSKPVAKKGGVALESRKALNDITNKSSIHLEASSQKRSSQNKTCNIVEDRYLHHHGFEAEALLKKKSSINEKLNIAEEGFLHDHSKCIEAQKAASELNFWDTVLPGHDSADLIMEEAKSDPDVDSMCCYPELEELSMSEFSDWFKSRWKSPPSSPISWGSPPPSPFSWELEPVELMLKEDGCDDV
ncbi:hypothetical protein Pfo_006691 [Paulownia fortunei]|nr:hypothetical protein Pfo_006691 [Paulownia fortunei]